MSKEKLVFVTDAETLAAIEANEFNSPVPVEIMPDGVWVYQWSLEQYRAGRDERLLSAESTGSEPEQREQS